MQEGPDAPLPQPVRAGVGGRHRKGDAAGSARARADARVHAWALHTVAGASLPAARARRPRAELSRGWLHRACCCAPRCARGWSCWRRGRRTARCSSSSARTSATRRRTWCWRARSCWSTSCPERAASREAAARRSGVGGGRRAAAGGAECEHRAACLERFSDGGVLSDRSGSCDAPSVPAACAGEQQCAHLCGWVGGWLGVQVAISSACAASSLRQGSPGFGVHLQHERSEDGVQAAVLGCVVGASTAARSGVACWRVTA